MGWTGKAGCWVDKGTANCVNWDRTKACRLACAGKSDIGRPTWITEYGKVDSMVPDRDRRHLAEYRGRDN